MKFDKYLNEDIIPKETNEAIFTKESDIQRVIFQAERVNWDGKIDDLIEAEFNVSTANFKMPSHINNYINKMLGRLVWRKTLGDEGRMGEIRIKLSMG